MSLLFSADDRKLLLLILWYKIGRGNGHLENLCCSSAEISNTFPRYSKIHAGESLPVSLDSRSVYLREPLLEKVFSIFVIKEKPWPVIPWRDSPPTSVYLLPTPPTPALRSLFTALQPSPSVASSYIDTVANYTWPSSLTSRAPSSAFVIESVTMTPTAV